MSTVLSIEYYVQQKQKDGRWLTLAIRRPDLDEEGLYMTPKRGIAHKKARTINPPSRVVRVETTIDQEFFGDQWVDDEWLVDEEEVWL